MATGDYPQHCSGCRCQPTYYGSEYTTSWVDAGGKSYGKTFTDVEVMTDFTEAEYNFPSTGEFREMFPEMFACGIKYDGAGRVCAYRHRHRYRLAAWLCGRWQAIWR